MADIKIEEDVDVSVQTNDGTGTGLQYFAFADNNTKTWFISEKNRKPYKELILLFNLMGERTIKPVKILDPSQPVVGSILRTLHGYNIEVTDCEWA